MATTPRVTEWMDPRWFAEDFVNLYEQVKGIDPDIREEYHKHAHNARLWLAATEDRRALSGGSAGESDVPTD